MKTGQVSEFVQGEGGWRLNLWDQNPAELIEGDLGNSN
jgi:hypothetical protein